MYSEDKMGVIVDRSRFDQFLLKRAAAQGVTVHEGEPVLEITRGKVINVKTPQAMYQSRYLIGADGANSVAALSLGYPRRHGGYTLECFIPDTYEVISKHAGSLTFYYGFLPSGYAWMFPKKGGASVGIGVLTKHTREIRAHFQKFLKAIGLPPEYAVHCKGFPLPAYTLRTHYKHGKDNILLAGDAACLVDPITGEGISNAMRSGVLAAQAIQQAIQGQGKASAIYDKSLKNIKQDLLVAYLMSIPLNTMPNITILVLRENREIVHLLKDIMLGKGRYGELIWALIKAIPNTIMAYLKGRR
jgi:flavin-dependent dehydrogenase